MSRVIDLTHDHHVRDALDTAIRELETGHVIAVPDECGWMLLGHSGSATASERLAQIRERQPFLVAAMAASNERAVEDYAGPLSILSRRLASRCWPGPLVFRIPKSEPAVAADAAPTSRPAWATEETGRAFYVPADAFTHRLLAELSGPACCLVPLRSDVSLFDIGQDQVSLEIRGAAARYEEPPTLAHCVGDRVVVESEGVVPQTTLDRLAGTIIMFVCTGNTCRSPMAEALFQKMLAEHLHCGEDELIDRGYIVVSAGLAAYPGTPASREAADLLRDSGMDLSGHHSQPVSEDRLFRCDTIYTMTRVHKDAILQAYPQLADRVQMLSPEGRDVSDPIGGGPEQYAKCRDEIAESLRRRIDEMKLGGVS